MIPPFHQRVQRMGLEHVGFVVGSQHVDRQPADELAGRRSVATRVFFRLRMELSRPARVRRRKREPG